ncbi:MAG: DUF4838 domain-containing protein [Clostridia bacterium]|nr:DUF4838 domain-containing protein [Clostridia bacterium]
MHIHVVLPYDGADTALYTWAREEKEIKFRFEKERAARCTVSFAATELIDYLNKLGFSTSFSSEKTKDTNFIIQIENNCSDAESYTLSCNQKDILLCGKGRAGVLYGVYDFLRMQGVKWLSPDDEILPEPPAEKLILPEEKIEFTPSMTLGRGFDFEGLLKDSTKLWKWMARNKMNLSCYRPHTAAFQKKLCMQFKMGGHVFDTFLNPDRVLPSGKTLWEEHNDFYGVDYDSERTKDNALWTQFCMSNEVLLDFLADDLLEYLNREWYEADRVDIWPLDIWTKSCQCDNCKKLGNGSDRALNLISHLRKRINKAVDEQVLDRNVRLVLCSYEGTDTLQPPQNPVPENIIRDGLDYIVFYPILRCYAHYFDDASCSINAVYENCLKGWKDIPVMIGEYYNVSKFEDMPLLFTKTMSHDICHYYDLGVRGMTYMHLPMLEWGLRNITQLTYAELCNNINADISKLEENYFKDRYKDMAEDMKEVYALCEEACKFITSFRSFRNDCVLIKMRYWDGTKPTEAFPLDDHLQGKAISEAEKSVKNYTKALEKIQDIRKKHFYNFGTTYVASLKEAVNPVELMKRRTDILGRRLNESVRMIEYGRDLMQLECLFLKYYDALLQNENGNEIWAELDALVIKLTDRFMPLTYVNSLENIELCCKDMIERSQFKEQYFKCMKYRIHNGLPV